MPPAYAPPHMTTMRRSVVPVARLRRPASSPGGGSKRHNDGYQKHDHHTKAERRNRHGQKCASEGSDESNPGNGCRRRMAGTPCGIASLQPRSANADEGVGPEMIAGSHRGNNSQKKQKCREYPCHDRQPGRSQCGCHAFRLTPGCVHVSCPTGPENVAESRGSGQGIVIHGYWECVPIGSSQQCLPLFHEPLITAIGIHTCPPLHT